jgi:hypothetical protein
MCLTTITKANHCSNNKNNYYYYYYYYYYYREIISLGDENTANARWEPAGTVPVTRQWR